jgi:RNA methyltransferase, TrmH family
MQANTDSLQSRNHPLLKRLRTIIRSGELMDEDQVLLETPRLIEDALTSNIQISTLVVRKPITSAAEHLIRLLPDACRIVHVAPRTFDELASTETSPGAIALADVPRWDRSHLFTKAPLLLVIAGVQDPGNLGTMLRSAEAFGFTGAIFTRGTVSSWNAKAFRASAGSALRIPVLRNFSPSEVVQLLDERQVKLYGAAARAEKSLDAIPPQGAVAIAVGAEGAGLPEELQRASELISIPMAAQVESLNVGAATAIILYELSRRRAELQAQLGARTNKKH